MVVVMVSSLVGGATSSLLLTARLGAQGADVVTASQVNILDSGGRLRAVLSGDDERGLASLAFYGPDGTLRGVVGSEPDGTPVLRFNNPGGVARLSAVVRQDDPVVTIGDEAARSVLLASIGGSPIVGVANQGRTRLQITLGAQGGPQLSLLGSAGQPAAGLTVGADDAPFLSLYDPMGVQRLLMGTVGGATVVNLSDGTRPRLVLGVADNGRPSVGFYDADGALQSDLSAETQQ
jgi:hypothetical protein